MIKLSIVFRDVIVVLAVVILCSTVKGECEMFQSSPDMQPPPHHESQGSNACVTLFWIAAVTIGLLRSSSGCANSISIVSTLLVTVCCTSPSAAAGPPSVLR